MHNPQNAGTIFRNCLIGSRPAGVAGVRLDPIRRADRRFDPVDSDVAYANRFPGVLGEADHPLLAPVLGDFRIEELAAQRFEPFERALLVRPHQPRIPRHIGGEDRGEPTFDATRPSRLHSASSVADNPTPMSRPAYWALHDIPNRATGPEIPILA